jgi:hypothetical protein
VIKQPTFSFRLDGQVGDPWLCHRSILFAQVSPPVARRRYLSPAVAAISPVHRMLNVLQAFNLLGMSNLFVPVVPLALKLGLIR